MKKLILSITFLVIVGALSVVYAFSTVEGKQQNRLSEVELAAVTGDAERGAYVAVTAGCVACHTDTENAGELLAGGVRFDSPFGVLYSPNITSDPTSGIGGWSIRDFMSAMLVGKSPSGEHYYPAFPYTSYSVMTTEDLVDLKAWLDSVPVISQRAPAHELTWPFSVRQSVAGWKALFFDPSRKIDDAGRGSYLVNGPGHCAECHASRNMLAGITDRALTGNANGPEGESVPGISHSDLVKWSVEDLELFLEVGMTPEGDFTGGHMADVIEYSTGQLTVDDRQAIARYLLSSEN